MADLTPEQIYRLQSILEAENNHDLVRGLGLSKARKPKPRAALPKKKRSKEAVNFTAIFGGGSILFLLAVYFGIEHGFILLKF